MFCSFKCIYDFSKCVTVYLGYVKWGLWTEGHWIHRCQGVILKTGNSLVVFTKTNILLLSESWLPDLPIQRQWKSLLCRLTSANENT